MGVVALLTACGGGGGDDAGIESGSNDNNANPPVANPPVTNPPVDNSVAKAFADGAYILWGFGLVSNGVPQVFVSRGTVDAGGRLTTAKVAGMTRSPETPPTLVDAVNDTFWTGTRSLTCQPKLTYSGAADAVVTCDGTSLPGIRWSMQLNQEDVAGKRVADYVRNQIGAAVTTTWANPGTTFPPGSVAYTSVFEASEDAVLVDDFSRLSFAQPAGAGWCRGAAGSAGRLGVLLNADKTLSIFEVATTACTFAGLTPTATGSWEEATLNGNTVYHLNYPESVRSDTRWASSFSSAYAPSARIGNMLMKNPADTTVWSLVTSIKKGDRFVSLQPHFNSAALPALKQVANLQ